MKKLSFSFFCVIIFITNIAKISAQTESNLNAYTPQIYYPNLQSEYSKNKKLEVENRSLFESKNTTILSTELYGDIAYVGCAYMPPSGITTPVYHQYYETDVYGKEIKMTQIGLLDGLSDSMVTIKNQKFNFKNQDFYDTATYYKKLFNGAYIPERRYIESYCYFDKFEVDSFYRESVTQIWDDKMEAWQDYAKTHYYFQDTILEHIWKYENLYFDEEGNYRKSGLTVDSLIYDNSGFVIEMYQTGYDLEMSNVYYKYVFTNDETGMPYEITRYIREEGESEYRENVTWMDWVWKEWHGFAFQTIMLIGGELRSPYAKRNKEDSYRIVQNGVTVAFQQKWWNIDAFESNTDTLYFYAGGNKVPALSYSNFYNDHGDYESWISTSWDIFPNGYGSQLLNSYAEYRTEYVYEEPFGRKEIKYYSIGKENVSLEYHIIKDFSFVGIPEVGSSDKLTFSIAPNPATGYTKIAAQEEIQYIEIFDLTGRLVKTEAIYTQEATVSFNNLSQGVYLLKAVFKKGGARTQKLIVQ